MNCWFCWAEIQPSASGLSNWRMNSWSGLTCTPCEHWLTLQQSRHSVWQQRRDGNEKGENHCRVQYKWQSWLNFLLLHIYSELYWVIYLTSCQWTPPAAILKAWVFGRFKPQRDNWERLSGRGQRNSNVCVDSLPREQVTKYWTHQ